jgi:hypothetical protein
MAGVEESTVTTTPAEPATVYVAIWHQRPIGVSAHLGDAQAAVLAQASKYDREPREYRWRLSLNGRDWDVLRRNKASGRWNWVATAVVAAPVVDAPTT